MGLEGRFEKVQAALAEVGRGEGRNTELLPSPLHTSAEVVWMLSSRPSKS